MRQRPWILGIVLTACGEPSASSDGLEPPTGVTATSTSGTEGTITRGDHDQATGAQATGEGGSTSEGTADTGVVFIDQPDGGMTTHECDPFLQDCPDGEKCMPWANDGGAAWNATRCSPLADDPGQPGDECTVEGSGTSGIDSCELGTMCWNVDPETNEGTCVAMCSGDEASPICDDPDTHCAITNEGALVLCLPSCDPILQGCPDGQACYPVQDDWACAPDASGETGVYGDPCEFLNVCDPGYICLDASAVPTGEACEGSVGCCTAICDITDPTGDGQCEGAAGGQTCQPWYEEGNAPPGYEDVGACALPA